MTDKERIGVEFKHIEYFIETCGHTSMSQAAEHLFISQQALSRCIQTLETELGCRLFHRTAKGSTLTEDGQYLYETFQPIVAAFHAEEAGVLHRLSDRPKRIVLASAPLIFGVLDTEILYSYREENPNITLEVMEMSDMDVDQYISEDASRFGIIAKPAHWYGERFSFTHVKTYPLNLCVHKEHPLASCREVSFGMLKDEKFLMLDKRSYFQQIIREKAGEYAFEPQIAFESADVNQLASLVNTNKGIFIATASPAFGTLFKNVRVIPFDDDTLTYSIAFVYQDLDKLEPQARKFVDFVKRAAE